MGQVSSSALLIPFYNILQAQNKQTLHRSNFLCTYSVVTITIFFEVYVVLFLMPGPEYSFCVFDSSLFAFYEHDIVCGQVGYEKVCLIGVLSFLGGFYGSPLSAYAMGLKRKQLGFVLQVFFDDPFEGETHEGVDVVLKEGEKFFGVVLFEIGFIAFDETKPEMQEGVFDGVYAFSGAAGVVKNRFFSFNDIIMFAQYLQIPGGRLPFWSSTELIPPMVFLPEAMASRME